MKKLILIIFLFFLLYNTASAATYYVDYTGGLDSNSGTSTEEAWKTISKVTSYDSGTGFNPDDSILFKRGETWREKLVTTNSGTAGHSITYGAYGSGAKPRIIGSVQIATWSDQGGNIWRADYGSMPVAVYFINTDDSITWGWKESASEDLDAEYDWYQSGSYIYIYAASDPDSRYTAIEAPVRDYCIGTANASSYLTFENLEFAYCIDIGLKGFQMTNSTFIGIYAHHISSRQVDPVYGNGLGLFGGDYNTIRDCIFSNLTRGVNIYSASDCGPSTGNLIEFCTFIDISHAGVNGIAVVGGTVQANIIRFNLFYHTTDYYTGRTSDDVYISAQQGNSSAIDNEIYGNLFYNSITRAIHLFLEQSTDSHTGTLIYNNSMYLTLSTYSAWRAGIGIGSAPNFSGVIIKNNIGAFDDTIALFIYSVTTGITFDYNNWHRIGGGDFADITGTGYSNLATYKSAMSPNEANTIITDPNFKNTSDLPTGFSGTYGTDMVPNNDGLSIESGGAIDTAVDLGGSPYYGAINLSGRSGGLNRDDHGGITWDRGAYELVEEEESGFISFGGDGTIATGGSGTMSLQ